MISAKPEDRLMVNKPAQKAMLQGNRRVSLPWEPESLFRPAASAHEVLIPAIVRKSLEGKCIRKKSQKPDRGLQKEPPVGFINVLLLNDYFFAAGAFFGDASVFLPDLVF